MFKLKKFNQLKKLSQINNFVCQFYGVSFRKQFFYSKFLIFFSHFHLYDLYGVLRACVYFDDFYRRTHRQFDNPQYAKVYTTIFGTHTRASDLVTFKSILQFFLNPNGKKIYRCTTADVTNFAKAHWNSYEFSPKIRPIASYVPNDKIVKRIRKWEITRREKVKIRVR